MLGYAFAHVDGCTPLGAVVGRAAAHDISVELHNSAADRSNLSIANGAMVHTDDGGKLRSCPAHEDFVGYVQLSTVYLSFAGDTAKLASCQFHNSVAGDTEQNIFGRSRGHEFAIHHQEDIFSAAF